jgi:hypothetical protein
MKKILSRAMRNLRIKVHNTDHSDPESYLRLRQATMMICVAMSTLSLQRSR